MIVGLPPAPGAPEGAVADAREALDTVGADLAAVVRLTGELERLQAGCPEVRLGITGNVTLDLIATFMRKHAALAGLRVTTDIGPIADRIGGARKLASAM